MSIGTQYIGPVKFQLRISIRISEQELHNIQNQRYEAIFYNHTQYNLITIYFFIFIPC